MYRSLALLALPLLLVGCGSSGSSRASSEPTIDSFRSSFLSGKQPDATSQLAAMPQPAAGQAKAAPKANSGDRSGKGAGALPTDASPLQQDNAAPYKASVAAYIKRYAVDDNSLKLAKIGTPFQGSVNGQKGSVVCVELGGLSGNRTAYLLRDNTVIDSEFGAAACRGKQLERWDNVGT
jgi:hypothetical protein